MADLSEIYWTNQGPIDALHYYIDYFGVMPSVISPVAGGMAVFTADDLKGVKIEGMNNIFNKIVIEDSNIFNSCPVPHYEYLTTYYDFDVPEKYLLDVMALSNSITYDPVLGSVALRGNNLDDNIYTLGLVTDIVSGVDSVYSLVSLGKNINKSKNIKSSYKKLMKRKRKGKKQGKKSCGMGIVKSGKKKSGKKKSGKKKSGKKKSSKKK
jgi:hypothetical protein